MSCCCEAGWRRVSVAQSAAATAAAEQSKNKKSNAAAPRPKARRRFAAPLGFASRVRAGERKQATRPLFTCRFNAVASGRDRPRRRGEKAEREHVRRPCRAVARPAGGEAHPVAQSAAATAAAEQSKNKKSNAAAPRPKARRRFAAPLGFASRVRAGERMSYCCEPAGGEADPLAHNAVTPQESDRMQPGAEGGRR